MVNMYSTYTQKSLNCSHNLDKYFEGKFIKDDYCFSCLDAIAEIETEQSIKR